MATQVSARGQATVGCSVWEKKGEPPDILLVVTSHASTLTVQLTPDAAMQLAAALAEDSRRAGGLEKMRERSDDPFLE